MNDDSILASAEREIAVITAECRRRVAAATARAERAEAEVEMQRAVLRRVRDLQARAEGYDFSIDPADLLAALDGTGGTE